MWPKAPGADIYTHHANSVSRVALPAPVQDAGLGNWYIGSLVLPSGAVWMNNKNAGFVVEPRSGALLARAPPLPEEAKLVVWE